MLEEEECHVNYLELLAAFLAIQTFSRDKTDLTVCIQMASVSALTYINKRGGCHSLSLTQLAKRVHVCEWCMERMITLVAKRIPGKLNTVEDSEYRMIRDHWDWKLNPVIFPESNRGLVNYKRTYFCLESLHNSPRSSARDQIPSWKQQMPSFRVGREGTIPTLRGPLTLVLCCMSDPNRPT